MFREQKREWLRAGLSAAILVAAVVFSENSWIGFMISYLIVGYPVLIKALRGIVRFEILDESFLMTIASLGAFAIGEYPEGVAVMLFYTVGELFQEAANGRTRDAVAKLMDIRPDTATLEGGRTVPAETVAVGSAIVVRPGERVPLDGAVIGGISALDQSALTGESMPRGVAVGDQALSGSVNLDAVLTLRVERAYSDSTVARILKLVESSGERKARVEGFLARFARVYTPIVIILAVLVAGVPVLIGQPFAPWLKRALIFLVVSCPCALVVSVPMGFFGGIGGASRAGILIKGANFMEVLAKAEVFAFDKTGTLTEGRFRVAEVHAEEVSPAELLKTAALAEQFSSHPVARSIVEAQPVSPDGVAGVREVPGRGVRAAVGGRDVLAGSRRMLLDEGIKAPELDGTAVYVAVDGTYAGAVILRDAPKPGAREALEKLRALGVKKTVMLSGDARTTTERVAKDVGVDECLAELMPGDKVASVERLLAEHPGRVAFVGDGINDAPVLARADVGIAMGGLGADAAIEAADVVLMRDDLSKLAAAVRVSRRTLAIVKQNIALSIGLKVAMMGLGALGIVGMWGAVFADVGVTILAVLNSMRALNGERF
ncbi:MAG: cadmium-translocating P-type ATPase [Clostridiales bacterium]|nr:cadmium-translocating P-type ATPase [Clostridiales bacterium]